MKITIADIVNRVSRENIPIGHELKTIKQAIELLEGNEINVAVNKAYGKYIKDINMLYLPFKCSAKRKHSAIVDMFKYFVNAYLSIFFSKHDMVWFIIIYEPLFWLISLLPKKKKYIITTYRDWDEKFNKKGIMISIRKKIYKYAIKKIDLMICTNKIYYPLCNHLYLPDFFLEKRYNKLNKERKENRAVCVGIMNKNKRLIELIDSWQINEIPLYIIGYFQDKEYYTEVMNHSKQGVYIEDRTMEENEYMQFLGKSKYVVLTYDLKNYSNRTSGVLQEAVSLGVIPIARTSLLKIYNMKGICFEEFSDISTELVKYIKNEYTINNNSQEFDFEECKHKLLCKLNQLYK